MTRTLSKEQLIDEKIQALLKGHKPRDFYDLYFILRSNLMPAGKKDIQSPVQFHIESLSKEREDIPMESGQSFITKFKHCSPIKLALLFHE